MFDLYDTGLYSHKAIADLLFEQGLQFQELIDTIDIDEIGVREKIRTEVERFKRFQQSILGIKTKVQIADIDIRNYAKYLLLEGTSMEKRELLSNLRSKLLLKEKRVSFA